MGIRLTPEEQAALERLRKMRAASNDHDGGYPATQAGRMQSAIDHCAAAEIAMRDHPVDDGDELRLPITIKLEVRDGLVRLYLQKHGKWKYIGEHSDELAVLTSFDRDIGLNIELEYPTEPPSDIEDLQFPPMPDNVKEAINKLMDTFERRDAMDAKLARDLCAEDRTAFVELNGNELTVACGNQYGPKGTPVRIGSYCGVLVINEVYHVPLEVVEPHPEQREPE